MKRLGFVFTSAPHGSASGREALDAVLAVSNYSENIALFFLGDGVMQLLAGQSPDTVLSRDYISTFKMLSLCDVEDVYISEDDLAERGVTEAGLVIDAECLSKSALAEKMAQCDRLMRF
ncbi:sulfurtransferase complex subunit TusC [Parasalinivibrio latis]|uniref:sulfurtransferase complex subunit TusC n=1 Tax=Parasalinivibrio latis TaxID=2952610 RepID=UPI0030E21712